MNNLIDIAGGLNSIVGETSSMSEYIFYGSAFLGASLLAVIGLDYTLGRHMNIKSQGRENAHQKK
jgi:hypothetical protein